MRLTVFLCSGSWQDPLSFSHWQKTTWRRRN
jgi:hypothetical protein